MKKSYVIDHEWTIIVVGVERHGVEVTISADDNLPVKDAILTLGWDLFCDMRAGDVYVGSNFTLQSGRVRSVGAPDEFETRVFAKVRHVHEV